jgi:outer membrane protein assembly factor BamB
MGQEHCTTLTDYGGGVPGWGYCESVLVDGDRVVCTPGGSQGAILALDRKTGKKIWQSADFAGEAQYASIVPATINGKKQYVQLTKSAVIGVDPANGGIIWKAAWPGETAVIPTPIVHEDSVYVTSGYGVGSQRFDIDGATANSAFSNKVMKNHHGGVIRIGDHLFGYSTVLAGFAKTEIGAQVWAEDANLAGGALR